MAKHWYAHIADMTVFGPRKFYSTAQSLPSLVLIGQTAPQIATLAKSVGDWSGL